MGPAPGGMSAVGGTGSEYFFYDNGVISDSKLGTGEFTAYVQKEASADGNRHRCAPDEGEAKVEAGTHEKKTISIDLEALRKKFVEDDCPILMKTLELTDEPIPLWWTAGRRSRSQTRSGSWASSIAPVLVSPSVSQHTASLTHLMCPGRIFQPRRLGMLQSMETLWVRKQQRCLGFEKP